MDISPVAAPLEARFQMNYRDLREKLKLAAMHSETRLNNTVHPLALAALIFAPAYALWAPILSPVLRAPGAWRWPGVLNMLVPQLIFALSLFYMAGMLFKLRQKQRDFFESNSITLDTNGATRHTEDSANSVKWRGIRRVVATDEYLGLFVGAGEGFIVPRRAFNSDDDWQRFVNFARQQWQHTQPDVPPIANA